MLATPFYKGQGLGNQLANYCATRMVAKRNGYDFGVQFPENFKGKDFMDLDMGVPVLGGRTSVEGQAPEELPEGFTEYYAEPVEMDGTLNVTGYDWGFIDIKDNTLVHGLLQGPGYLEAALPYCKSLIDSWLHVEPIEIPDNVCVINVRGGEYKYVPSFILTKSYWENGIAHMLGVNPDMVFQVHTDDYDYAKSLFPDYEVISNIGVNWRSIRHAKHLLLSNSSFAILPAWLNEKAYIVAPQYFAGHNVGKWSLKQNYISDWNYIV